MPERIKPFKLAEILRDVTQEYTYAFFHAHPNTKMDKQYWAALHLGFVTALKQCEYTDEEIEDVLKMAQKLIKDAQ